MVRVIHIRNTSNQLFTKSDDEIRVQPVHACGCTTIKAE